MKILHFDDPVEFQEITRDFLLRSEAENNLPLGILASIIAGEYLETQPLLTTVEDEGKPLLVAMCTPPHPAIFSYQEVPPSSDILAGIINELRDKWGEDFTGITGNKSLTSAFTKTWEVLTGIKAKLNTAMRIYKLECVNPIAGVPGRMRPVNEGDEDTLLEWYPDFLGEATGQKPDPARVKKWVLRYRNVEKYQRGLMIWEVDEKPVSMAGYSGPTPHGIRIGAVYTPDDQRKKGFASACTAGTSQYLLNLGFQFCFLFTDLINPTSNHIYQQIGYTAVCDMDQYDFLVSDTKDLA